MIGGYGHPFRQFTDIANMPMFNTGVLNGQRSVSNGKVIVKFYEHFNDNYPECVQHGAMNKVSESGIWRCCELGCNVGAYERKN